jgi:5-amino-6-(5-phospho-D-ribitylamino)uracil phosphatase
MDLLDHSASKLSAIRFLTQKLHITLEDVLVFGDDLNDMEMITHCGCGVAMKNALPQVQAAANATTLSNEEDGVAVYLNTLLS